MLIDLPLPLRFSTGFAYYSLALSVGEFGFNLYLLQLVFGGVDIPAKFVSILSMTYLGRHITLATTLVLAGGSILALIFVPSGERLELPQDPLKEADPRRPVCLRASQAGKWGVGDYSSTDFISSSPCYLEQVPVLSGAQVAHLENSAGELDDNKTPSES